MRRSLRRGWIALICASSSFLISTAIGTLHGATLFVDGQIGSASCANYNPASRTCGQSGTNTAYRTVNAAAAAATAGTTVLIRAGTYNEQLHPANSGAPGNYVTFKNYGTEAVYLTGSPAISLSGRNCLIIEGLHAEDTTWLESQNSHSNILRRCIFKRTPASGTTGNVRFVQSHYNMILENDIEDGNDNLLLIDSNFNLVAGNVVTEARHSIFGIRCGDFNVIRSNYFSNSQQKIGEVYDCGVDTSAVAHSFNSTKHNIIEGNTFAQTSTYYSTSGGNGIQYGGQEGIIRGNVFYHCNVGLGMQVYSDESLYNTTNRVYQNVFYDNVGPGISTRGGNTNNWYKNNILFANKGCFSDCLGVSPGQIVYRTSLGQSSIFDNNDILYQSSGQAVIEEEFGSGSTVAQFAAANPGVLLNTLEVDPQFVDATNYDFRLQGTSPLIDAGVFLTKTVGTGTGTTIPIADARYFYDGFHIPGEQGDLVQLQGQAQPVRILLVDYANNTLTVDQSLSWTNSQGIALRFFGAGPDIGAFEFDPPLLSIRRESQNVIITWPAFYKGFHLQLSPVLPALMWDDAGSAVIVSDYWTVTNSTQGIRFFRLAN